MNAYIYDLPKQTISNPNHKKTHIQKSTTQLQQLYTQNNKQYEQKPSQQQQQQQEQDSEQQQNRYKNINIHKKMNNYVNDDDQLFDNRRYDLPCQKIRINSDYIQERYYENRPVVYKSPFQDKINDKGHNNSILKMSPMETNYSNPSTSINKNTNTNTNANSNTNTNSNVNTNTNTTSNIYPNLAYKGRVQSIYQKLLQQQKKNKIKSNQQILTQATFKPKQLRKQIRQHRQSQSSISKKQNNNRQNYNNSHSKMKSKSTHSMNTNSHVHMKSKSKDKDRNINGTANKGNIQHIKKLQYGSSQAKTKYQQILEEHFQTKFSSKKYDILTVEEMRLAKICGRNSTILKLKQRLEPNFASNKNKKQVIQLRQKLQTAKISYQIPKQNLQPNQTIFKQKVDPIAKTQQKSKQLQRQLNKCQSQRWLSMNFYQRQQRILANRKQKQTIGKQQKIQKQIKPCTFKPELSTKTKSLKTLPIQKNSYLEQYYEKQYRRY